MNENLYRNTYFYTRFTIYILLCIVHMISTYVLESTHFLQLVVLFLHIYNRVVVVVAIIGCDVASRALQMYMCMVYIVSI